MLKQSSSIRGDRYTFEVHLNNGALKPDLKRSFLRRCEVSWHSEYVTLEDNTRWEVHASKGVIDALREKESVECMVSFQVFHNGEQIAVARLYQDKGCSNGSR